uniref:G-protein coupled receptor family C group 5 member B-like n=1 Tax=Phallusia mammillata TaxID=59560 RepID=A0A6F9DEN1_9ASCI|nr:G-protein coupled receptor family C group 5 member B-like [Phallusia mammillata]
MSSVPASCGSIPSEFTNLCDTSQLWGIIVIGVAGLGLLLTLIFAIVFSANLMRFVRHEKHRYSTILYFVLIGVFLLFSFSIPFIIKPTEIACILRRVGMGIAWTVTLSPLLVGITRTWRMSYLDEIRCGWLAMAVCCFVCVEIIIVTEWCILRPPVPQNTTVNGTIMCEPNTQDLPLSLVFNAFLLLLYFISSIVSLCKREHTVSMNKRYSSFSVSSLATSFLVILLAVAWVVMVTYGNGALGKEEWFDPATAIFMVASGMCILLVIFSPVFATMRKLRHGDVDDVLYGNGAATPERTMYGSQKYTSQSTLPTEGRNAYGTSMERLQSFRSASGETAIAMSHIHPVPAKRNGVNNNVDRLRAPTGGRLNPTLELTEEDIWRDRHV